MKKLFLGILWTELTELKKILIDYSYKTIYKEEIPPVGTQEVYCPPHSKYTLCCSGWGYHPVLGPQIDGRVPVPRSR